MFGKIQNFVHCSDEYTQSNEFYEADAATSVRNLLWLRRRGHECRALPGIIGLDVHGTHGDPTARLHDRRPYDGALRHALCLIPLEWRMRVA